MHKGESAIENELTIAMRPLTGTLDNHSARTDYDGRLDHEREPVALLIKPLSWADPKKIIRLALPNDQAIAEARPGSVVSANSRISRQSQCQW